MRKFLNLLQNIGSGIVILLLVYGGLASDSLIVKGLCLFFVGWAFLSIIVSPATDFLKRRFPPKCPHGVRGGDELLIVDGKQVCKCNKCQENHEKQLYEVQQERKHKEELENKKNGYSSKFRAMINNAITMRENALLDNAEYLHSVEPDKFESIVAELFKSMGYDVELTPFINDGGKDIIVKKDNEVSYVECKRYSKKNRVGRPEIQKLVGAMIGAHVERGFFVTTSHFTNTAIEYAKACKVTLIDLESLTDLIHEFIQNDIQQEYPMICRECGDIVTFKLFNDVESKHCTNGHTVRNIFYSVKANDPICPSCGSAFEKKKGNYSKNEYGRRVTINGEFYECINPFCKFILENDEYNRLRTHQKKHFIK